MYKIREALGMSEIGKRSANEDAIYPILVKDEMTAELKKQVPEIEGLYVLCDGVGGANKGEIAAFLTTVNFPVYFANRKPSNQALSYNYLQEGVLFIEKALDAFIAQNSYATGMACTLTLLYFNEFGANIGWAGDSRVYHIRQGEILYQTYDHSYVNELLKMGQITAEEAQTHKKKNVILRAIQGSENPTEIEVHTIPWSDMQTGDVFMLCSDGITETFSNEKIGISFETHNNLHHLLETISQNCEIHSKDNYSCYLVEIGERIGEVQEAEQTAFLPPINMETPKLETLENVEVAEIEEEEVVEPAIEIPVQEVSHTLVPEIKENTSQIASLLDKIQANLPNVPHTEEEEDKEKPVIVAATEPPIIAPVIPQPESQFIPPYMPESNPKKGFPILMFLAGVAIILLLVCGVLWYHIYGPGTENSKFKEYYSNAESKVKECESNGRCLEAKGAVNQAKDAAETSEEFKKVEDLMTIIRKKEDEIKQKDRLLSPEPMDKGKVEPTTTPKSPTTTPKAPANVPPSKDTKTTVTPPKTDTKATTPPKPDVKPTDTKTPTPAPKPDIKPTDTKTPTPTPAPKPDIKPTDNKTSTTPKPPQGIKVGEPAPPTKPPKTPPPGGE